MKSHFKLLFTTAPIMSLLTACDRAPDAQREQQARPASSVAIQTPESIAIEHGELHEALAGMAAEPGEMAAAARDLERALAPHFKREEQIATPPLGLLPALAKGDATAEMRSILPMTDALERELPQMLREHEVIRRALTKFRTAAERNGRQDYMRFAANLAAHAREEEEILYPAAIVVGRYVKRTAPK